MKEIFFIKDTTVNKISYYHLLFFLMALPFDRIYSELALISLCIHTVIHLRKETIRRLQWGQLLVLTSVYLLTCVGTLYTHYYDEAFFEWERQLALLLFPFVFATTSLDLKKYSLPLLKGLTLSCTLTIVYLYFDSLHTIQYNHLPLSALFSNAFINHNFSLPIDLHATYFSMYIALSAATLIYLLLQAQGPMHRLLLLAGLLILLAGLLQLSARSVLIAFLLIVTIIIPFFLLKRLQRTRFMLCAFALSALAVLLVTRSDSLRNRYGVELKGDLTQEIINNNILEPRAVRWQCAWALVKQSPVWGHGSGSEIALLKEVYFQHRYYNSYLNELNAHNQYLSLMIKTGVIGCFVFLWLLYQGFQQAIRSKDLFFCSFLILAATVSFSENILDVNKGIFFFAFFFSYFYYSNTKLLQYTASPGC